MNATQDAVEADGFDLRALLARRRHLPVIRQNEVAECGLCCLAMVARFHGHRFEMSDLRRRLPISIKGATLESLVGIAEALQLDSRPLQVALEALDQLQLPCVLHWDMNHFVVLARVTRRGLVIHDPAVGERRMSFADASRHFTGIALELSPSADFTPAEARPPTRLSDLVGKLVGLGPAIAQVLGLAFAMELLAVAMPFQLQWIVDHALVAADRPLIATLSLGFLGLVLLRAIIDALRGWLIATASTQINFQWMGNVFGHLLKLPISYFERRHLGLIQSYFGSIDHIQRTLTTGFTQAVIDGLLVMGTGVMMFLYSPSLSLIALGALLCYGLVRRLAFTHQRDAVAEEIVCDGRQHTHFLETVRGIQAVRLFGRASQRRIGWTNMLAEQFNARLRAEKVQVLQRAANAGLFGIESVLIVWLAALAVLRAEITLGMLFAFLAYKQQFSTRSAELVDKLVELSMLRLHAERVADVVQQPQELAEARGHVDLRGVEPSIELRGVSFGYSAVEPEVLSGIDLFIEAGESVAITGASGCGKTTLTKIVTGLLEPTGGTVFLGGQPLRNIGLANYRGIVGTVMQDDTLFTGSLADNICFFEPVPDIERIEQCARLAAVHEEIMGMPMGYHTMVGDIGSGLSGGQKQRVLLARALYRRPRILVLDEATSHLDVLNERSINETIKAMRLTRIIVAHRPETIDSADRVVVIEKGRVVRNLANRSRIAGLA
jgi:ATP-binding cassette subfamily B protein RaxB